MLRWGERTREPNSESRRDDSAEVDSCYPFGMLIKARGYTLPTGVVERCRYG